MLCLCADQESIKNDQFRGHTLRAISEIARAPSISPDSTLSGKENYMTEKFHPYLSPDLLIQDATSSRIDLDAMPMLAHRMLAGGELV